MSDLVVFRLQFFKKLLSYLKWATSNLTNPMNFGIGPSFPKGERSAFSQGPLFLNVHFKKYEIWWLTLQAYLELSRTWSFFFLGSKYASEYYNHFFSWCLHVRVNDLLNFFSTIIFSCQYPPEVEAY